MKLNRAGCNSNPRRRAQRLSLLGALLCLAIGFSACESINDDQLEDCRLGIALKFVYDYHMEPGANAFKTNVDCVNVYVFDMNGNYVTQFKETDDILRTDDYRMDMPLDEGDYHLVVFGGLACETATFDFTPEWNTPNNRSDWNQSDIRVTLPLNAEGISQKQLHDLASDKDPDSKPWGGLFWGTLDFSLSEKDLAANYREETVYLRKDTNNIQVILEELSSPYITNWEDYTFQIIDDNFVLDAENNVAQYLATDDFQPHYKPYATENRIMGYVDYQDQDGALNTEDERRPVQVACAEFSTSRLLIDHFDTARLVVSSALEHDANGIPKKIIDIPLITYLSAIRGFGDNWIKSDQEFLDRQSRWTLMFFLQRNAWVRARVSVNAWTVRINEAELG